jgi:hypothetical protein
MQIKGSTYAILDTHHHAAPFFFHSAWCFSFLLSVKLFDLYYSVSRVLLRPLGGVISITVGFYYSILPFVPLWQKGGVIFYLDRECISKPVKCFLSQSGQRGSLLVLLASLCVWTKTLVCKRCCKQGFHYSEWCQKIPPVS